MKMPDNGVLRTPDWSVKSWWSSLQQAWLVQVEHYVLAQNGWIRAWLVDSHGDLQRYATLAESTAAIEAFMDHPDWGLCRSFHGV